MTKTIDDYIRERNDIQLWAEPGNPGNPHAERAAADAYAKSVWAELGVANRHIERVLDGMFTLPQVEREIDACLARAKRLFGMPENISKNN